MGLDTTNLSINYMVSSSFFTLDIYIKNDGFTEKNKRTLDLCIISYMASKIRKSVETNSMKVHNNFNSYKKYSLRQLKSILKKYDLLKYMEKDSFYIEEFTFMFNLANMNGFGNQKVLNRENLETALLKVFITSFDMEDLT